MASLGSAALVVAWLAALYMVAAAFFGARSGRHAYVVSARRATYALTGLLVLAFGRARGTDPRSEPPLRRRGRRGPSADRRRLVERYHIRSAPATLRLIIFPMVAWVYLGGPSSSSAA